MNTPAPVKALTPHVYNGRIQRIVDGDTVDVLLDLGFDTLRTERFRLYGINAPERREASGPAATAFLNMLIPPGTKVTIQSHKSHLSKDKYGRWLADIFPDGQQVSVSERMVQAGHAVIFMA